MSNSDTSAATLAKQIKNSPAGPLLHEYFTARLAVVSKQKDQAADFNTFDKLRAQQVLLESLLKRLAREEP